ncbi:hypothetical protein Tco_1155578 [Tanacetum coccineum]
MTGVPRNIAEHRLNIREGYSPVRQKKRGQAPERNKVIQEEVEKLVDAGIMKESHTKKKSSETKQKPFKTLRHINMKIAPKEMHLRNAGSASKRLKRYFQAHTIVVITNQPIKQLLSSSEISGRMLKWKFELEGYDIPNNRPREPCNQSPIRQILLWKTTGIRVLRTELMTEHRSTTGAMDVVHHGCCILVIWLRKQDLILNKSGRGIIYICHEVLDSDTNNESRNMEALIAGLGSQNKWVVKELASKC